MTKHIHAELMMKYAQDALETDEPWLRWERQEGIYPWFPCSSHPHWRDSVNYRRKPKTININGFEVPEPVRQPLKYGQRYYLATITGEVDYNYRWQALLGFENQWLEDGLIHLNKEAAKLHREALLSFTKNNS